MKAFAPNGFPILGTLETVQCRAETEPDSFSRDENGELDWDHSGGETEIFWDSIRTERSEGSDEALFLDEEGNEWRESELVLEEEPADTVAVAKPISEAEMAEIARAGKDLMSNLTRTKR